MKSNATIRKWRRLIVSCLALVAIARGSVARGQDDVEDEYEIRAEMIFNLAKFVEWPASKAGDPVSAFVICELGADSVTANLDKILRGQAVSGRPVAVRHLNKDSAAGGCHILYVAHADRKVFEQLAPELMKQAVLSVGYQDWFTSAGGVVSLPMVDDRIRIQVSLGVAQRSGLNFSSKLLRLATVLH
jgi:hypothetical protein